jgi:hypothetical protein
MLLLLACAMLAAGAAEDLGLAFPGSAEQLLALPDGAALLSAQLAARGFARFAPPQPMRAQLQAQLSPGR